MPAGWFDGDGITFSKKFLDRIECWLDGATFFYDFPVPWLVPCPDGEVSAEWHSKEYDLTIVFYPDETVSVWGHSLNQLTGNVVEVELGTDPFKDGAAKLGKYVHTFFPKE